MDTLMIFWILVLIFSAVIHEVSHGFMALKLGDPTAQLAGRLTLNPLPHLDLFGSIILPLLIVISGAPIFIAWAKPVPFNPYNLQNGKWGPAYVALAGPLSNFLIAIIFGTVIRFALPLGITSGVFIDLLSLVVLINIGLGTFNFLPIPPLDGSKVLFALLPYQYNHIRTILEQYGFFILILFIMMFRGVLIPIISFLFTIITGVNSGF